MKSKEQEFQEGVKRLCEYGQFGKPHNAIQAPDKQVPKDAEITELELGFMDAAKNLRRLGRSDVDIRELLDGIYSLD